MTPHANCLTMAGTDVVAVVAAVVAAGGAVAAGAVATAPLIGGDDLSPVLRFTYSATTL